MPPAAVAELLSVASSALWKSLHKADYAKSLIMESSRSEHAPRADLQHPARI
jgi:hypothetical protein